jgi:hypothetical protein
MLTAFDRKDYPRLPGGWAAEPGHTKLKNFNQVVMWACEPNATRRYRTAEELNLDLGFLKIGKTLAVQKLQRALHRHRWLLVGVTPAADCCCAGSGRQRNVAVSGVYTNWARHQAQSCRTNKPKRTG